ncbi:DNA primase catalytic subunit PriS [Candidatus Altiarchaeota archaeon]
MDTDTKIHLKRKFKEFYFKNPVKPPAEVHKREFGVGTLEDKIKIRHKSFASGAALNQYLRTDAPYYISYSIAYYEYPENQPIKTKNWNGADLVFDLDRDIKWLNQEQMDEVRDEAITLSEFLISDFGISASDITQNFSGSKGYHIHVFDPSLRSLGSDERREIIDYLTATGLELDYFIRTVDSPDGITFQKRGPKLSGGSRVGPRRGDKGWPERIYLQARHLLASDEEELRGDYGLTPRMAKKIVANRDRNLEFIDKGKWDAVFDVRSKLRKMLFKEYAVKILEDADRMVTFDTSRLIRLPDSIHAGTGLAAAQAKDIGSFNPLVDAVAFSDEPEKIRVTKDVPTFQFMENEWGPYKAGDGLSLPGYVSMYLMLKDHAEVVRTI